MWQKERENGLDVSMDVSMGSQQRRQQTAQSWPPAHHAVYSSYPPCLFTKELTLHVCQRRRETLPLYNLLCYSAPDERETVRGWTAAMAVRRSHPLLGGAHTDNFINIDKNLKSTTPFRLWQWHVPLPPTSEQPWLALHAMEPGWGPA